MKEQFEFALKNIGENSNVITWKKLLGGEINDSYYVKTTENEYFIKYQYGLSSEFFKAEALGLNTIRYSKTVQVPYIFGLGDGDGFSYLVLEWVDGTVTNKTLEILGQNIAKLHLTRGNAFGFHEDNFVGTLPQYNSWDDSWIDFFRDNRLNTQLTIAVNKGLLPTNAQHQFDKLLNRLEEWLSNDVKPSLLHGDLWVGNCLASGKDGMPYIIDPAVFFGHNEMELAYTQMFGRFPDEFYKAYDEVYPISPEYQDRKSLYQLYYLLIHLNIFGERYFGDVKAVLNKYVGQ